MGFCSLGSRARYGNPTPKSRIESQNLGIIRVGRDLKDQAGSPAVSGWGSRWLLTAQGAAHNGRLVSGHPSQGSIRRVGITGMSSEGQSDKLFCVFDGPLIWWTTATFQREADRILLSLNWFWQVFSFPAAFVQRASRSFSSGFLLLSCTSSKQRHYFFFFPLFQTCLSFKTTNINSLSNLEEQRLWDKIILPQRCL